MSSAEITRSPFDKLTTSLRMAVRDLADGCPESVIAYSMRAGNWKLSVQLYDILVG